MKSSPTRLVLLVATRKGAWLFHGDTRREAWPADGPHFLGHIVSHVLLDPRDGRTLLAAAKTGHLGPTVFRSTDLGRTWKEAAPAAGVRQAAEGRCRPRGRSHVLADAGPRQRAGRLVRRHLAAGPVPLRGRRRHLGAAAGRQRRSAVPRVDGHGAGRHARRAEAALDHRRPARPGAPVLRACRAAACTNRSTRAAAGRPLVEGMEVVEGFDAATVTFHDPHCVRLCPSNPDRLYQQNHCGIYRLDRPGTAWVRIGSSMPEPRSATSASRWWCIRATPTPPGCSRWTAPTSGRAPAPPAGRRPTSRATAGGAGSGWTRACRGAGLVDREAPGHDGRCDAGVGLYFGTTSGELWIEPRRRRALGLHRAPPARDLRGGSRGAGVSAPRASEPPR